MANSRVRVLGLEQPVFYDFTAVNVQGGSGSGDD